MILYTDIDEQCCQWLENLIRYGALPKGDVLCEDIKSVERVDPKYHQIHWCCGIGGWPLAFQLAGWHPERPVVSVSAPCQPFSQAGKQAGTSDPRHLWPHIFRLLQTFRPPLIVGEQVSGAAGYGWFDGVASDLEGENYACRAIDAPSCSVDAPHIRSRLYWIASLSGHGAAVADTRLLDGRAGPGLTQDRQIGPDGYGSERGGYTAGPLAQPQYGGCEGRHEEGAGTGPAYTSDGGYSESGVDQVDAQSIGRGEGRTQPILRSGRPAATGADAPSDVGVTDRSRFVTEGLRLCRQDEGPVPSRADGRESFWSGAEWLACHDGKARRVPSGEISSQPGLPLLVNGVSGRVAVLRPGVERETAQQEDYRWVNRIGAWRGFGNAINPEFAKEVILAFLESEQGGY